MVKYLRISSYIRKPFLITDFATAPFRIFLYMRKILFSFLIVQPAKIEYSFHTIFMVTQIQCMDLVTVLAQQHDSAKPGRGFCSLQDKQRSFPQKQTKQILTLYCH